MRVNEAQKSSALFTMKEGFPFGGCKIFKCVRFIWCLLHDYRSFRSLFINHNGTSDVINRSFFVLYDIYPAPMFVQTLILISTKPHTTFLKDMKPACLFCLMHNNKSRSFEKIDRSEGQRHELHKKVPIYLRCCLAFLFLPFLTMYLWTMKARVDYTSYNSLFY